MVKYKLKKLNPPHQDKEKLYQLYVNEEKNFSEIGKILGCSDDTVKYSLVKYKIPLRKFTQKTNVDDVDLYSLYIVQKMSINKISKLFNSSERTIKQKLIELDIPIRGMSESQCAYYDKEYSDLLLDKDWLYNAYINEKLNTPEIGRILGHNATTIIRYLKRFDIPIRDGSESKIGLLSGDKHHNWKGGVTPLSILCREYFQTNIVPKIAERDNYTCQLCGKTHTILHVHHIYYFSRIIKDITNEHPELSLSNQKDRQKLYNIIISDHRFNDGSNLITYCKECHCYKIHKYTKKTISSQASGEEGSTTIESTQICGSE